MADKEGFGFLYPQERETSRHPSLTGHVVVEGRKIELAAWPKTSKAGKKYLSLKGTDKGPAEEVQEGSQEPIPTVNGTEDDIPF